MISQEAACWSWPNIPCTVTPTDAKMQGGKGGRQNPKTKISTLTQQLKELEEELAAVEKDCAQLDEENKALLEQAQSREAEVERERAKIARAMPPPQQAPAAAAASPQGAQVRCSACGHKSPAHRHAMSTTRVLQSKHLDSFNFVCIRSASLQSTSYIEHVSSASISVCAARSRAAGRRWHARGSTARPWRGRGPRPRHHVMPRMHIHSHARHAGGLSTPRPGAHLLSAAAAHAAHRGAVP
jgi:hypothetical protein